MNYLGMNSQFETIEDGIEKLKAGVSIRNQMGGAMYFNILNDDCCKIANKLLRMGADRKTLGEILGDNNFH